MMSLDRKRQRVANMTCRAGILVALAAMASPTAAAGVSDDAVAAWYSSDASDSAGKDEPAPKLAPEVLAFRKVVRRKDVATFSAAALALRRYMIANDPHRPVYHFTGPESWINDTNGPIYHKGKYHLFYQYDPIVDGRRSKRCWGHAVSTDLVHWRDWPVALWPDTKYDRNGVYSGNTAIDEDGEPIALYTGNVRGHAETYGMLARSRDGLLTWEKKMVMAKPPYPGTPVHWDAQVWRDGGVWHQLIGGTKSGEGAANLWTSTDLENWTFRKTIYSGPPGQFWELPYLVPFGEKYALLLGVRGNPYWIGTYDRKAMTFTRDTPKLRHIDRGSYYAVNPHMVDDKGPGGSARRILWAWVTGPPSPTKTVPYWQGVLPVPRVLTLAGGRLYQRPVPEIEVLRGKRKSFRNLAATPQTSGVLDGAGGDALEIVAAFRPGSAKQFGLKVRVSPGGRRFLRVWYDTKTGTFGVAQNGPGGKGGVAGELKPGQVVTLRVFVDRSVLEVFCNGNALTKRMFLPASDRGVAVFAQGGQCVAATLDVWRMESAWPVP